MYKSLKIGIVNCEFGENVKVVEPVNMYGCKIDDNCFIGPFVEIQKKVNIGANTRVQSHSFICELVDIGDDCFIGHGVMFINDLFSEGKPAGGDQSKWMPTSIGNNVSIGSNATILPVKICDNVVIGAGSVVTKNIEESGIYAGNPAKKLDNRMVKFLDLQHQYSTIREEIDSAIANVISRSAFIGGEELKAFEKNFASFQNVKHCIGVANGTDALEIAIEALDLPAGSEIIIPANSFIASSEAITRSGYKVVFCDSTTENYMISIDGIKEVITENTKAIIAVHLYGHPCDMDALLAIAKEHDLKIIEDCAQAHGAEYKGKRIGAIGDIGTFSFYPGKNLGAYGDGGAIVTNDEKLAIKSRMIANHGRVEKYNHIFEGRNSRLDNLQAAILNVKLEHLEDWTNQRIKIADYYLENLKDVSQIVLPKRSEWARQVYHLFVIRTDRREELKSYLAEQNIQTGIHYPIALPKLEAYKYLNKAEANFNANTLDSLVLSLPIGEHLSIESVEKVVIAIKNFFA